jgi:hypothetical protein
MAKFSNVEHPSHKVMRLGPHKMATKSQPGKLNRKSRMRGRRGIRK